MTTYDLYIFAACIVGDYMMIHGGYNASFAAFGDARFYSFVISTWSIPAGLTLGPRYGHTTGICANS